MNMKKNLMLCFLSLQFFTKIEASDIKHYEMPHTQVVSILDSQSDKQYELYIKLPEDYSKNTGKKYPVIYITDAVWHIEALSAATNYIMEDVILVGISWQKNIDEDLVQQYGAHASRFSDYSFWKVSNPNHPKIKFGSADSHLRFIREQVFNYIDNHYRTDPNNRSYFGYSLSGVFGAYILYTQPETFKNYILGSPSVRLIIGGDHKVEPTNITHETNVLVTHGDLEKETGEHVQTFVDLLKKRNNKKLSVEYAVLKGNHQTAFPATGVHSVTWLSELQKYHDEFPVIEGPYMGQKPPGLTAEPFAPGIISKQGWDIEGVFAPGMQEFYFTTRRNNNHPITVIGFRQTNNLWNKYIEFERDGEITFSPDGQRMYMADGYMDRVGDGWSDRKTLGPMFDRDDWGIMRLTASAHGTYVFDDFKSNDVIRISTLKDGKRQPPEKMSAVINTGKWTAHPFIAPDESYLIWDSEREGGYGDTDLYISFRQNDGSWGPAINMGDKVNSKMGDAYASVTADGKYIIFNRHGVGNDSGNSDIYWIDAQIIETLRPQ